MKISHIILLVAVVSVICLSTVDAYGNNNKNRGNKKGGVPSNNGRKGNYGNNGYRGNHGNRGVGRGYNKDKDSDNKGGYGYKRGNSKAGYKNKDKKFNQGPFNKGGY